MLEVAGFRSLAVSNGMKAAVPAIPSRVPAWRALLNETENYLFAMAFQTTIYRHLVVMICPSMEILLPYAMQESSAPMTPVDVL